MENEIARFFWNNVQSCLKGRTFKSVCSDAGLNYLSIANRKSGKTPSLPRLESAYAIAKTLGVSIEFLLTGEEPAKQGYPPRIQAIIEILLDDENKLNAVCTLLQIPTEEAGISGTKAV